MKRSREGMIPRGRRPTSVAHRGFSQVEVLVAVAILGVAFVGGVASFRGIAMSLTRSNVEKTAALLAQEKIDQLKAQPYAMLPTTSDALYAGSNISKRKYFKLAPDDSRGYVIYDNVNYGGLEDLSRSNQKFKRMVQVVPLQKGKRSGDLSVEHMLFDNGVPLSNANVDERTDSGLKLIVVTVVWEEKPGYWRNFALKSMKANENPDLPSLYFDVMARNELGQPKSGVIISSRASMAGNNARTTGAGVAKLYVSAGTHTLQTSCVDTLQTPDLYYMPVRKTAYVGYDTPGGFTHVDFTVIPSADGMMKLTPWMSRAPLISRVVSSTQPTGVMVDQKYVELYNPTTTTWLLKGVVGLKVRKNGGGPDIDLLDVANTTWVRDSIPPRGYFLVGSAASISLPSLGAPVVVDAQWTAGFLAANDVVPATASFRLELLGGATASPYTLLFARGTEDDPLPTKYLDIFGYGVPLTPWMESLDEFDRRVMVPATKYVSGTQGLSPGAQFYRFSSSTSYTTALANRTWGGGHWGPGYDTDDNLRDFGWEKNITNVPRNALSPAASPLWGYAKPDTLKTYEKNFKIASDEGIYEGRERNHRFIYDMRPKTAQVQAGTGWDMKYLSMFNSSGSGSLDEGVVIATGMRTVYCYYKPTTAPGNPFSQVLRKNVSSFNVAIASFAFYQPWLEDVETQCIVFGDVTDWWSYEMGGVPVAVKDIDLGTRFVTATAARGFFFMSLPTSAHSFALDINNWADPGAMLDYDNGGMGTVKSDGNQGLDNLDLSKPDAIYAATKLYGAGKATGWVTTTGSPGPGGGVAGVVVSLSGLKSGQLARQSTTDATGQFTVYAPVGQYLVTPVMRTGEGVVPLSARWELRGDAQIYQADTGLLLADTDRVFRMTTGYGVLAGMVKNAFGETLSDGTTLVLSTLTLSGLPQALTPEFRFSHPHYYVNTTGPDGSYRLTASDGTYQLYAWRLTRDANGVSSLERRGPFSVTIQMGQTLNQNVVW